MTLEKEVESLRRRLDELARDSDDELTGRYELRRPPLPSGLYWRLRWLAGSLLRWLSSMTGWGPDPWPVSLKQVRDARSKPLLVWAVGVDRDTVRTGCEGVLKIEKSWQGFAPVLVTDVADFAFFSRLGWLVEYLPQLPGEGAPYEERKLKFLARLYEGVPVLPVSIALETNRSTQEIRRWIGALKADKRNLC